MMELTFSLAEQPVSQIKFHQEITLVAKRYRWFFVFIPANYITTLKYTHIHRRSNILSVLLSVCSILITTVCTVWVAPVSLPRQYRYIFQLPCQSTLYTIPKLFRISSIRLIVKRLDSCDLSGVSVLPETHTVSVYLFRPKLNITNRSI